MVGDNPAFAVRNALFIDSVSDIGTHLSSASAPAIGNDGPSLLLPGSLLFDAENLALVCTPYHSTGPC